METNDNSLQRRSRRLWAEKALRPDPIKPAAPARSTAPTGAFGNCGDCQHYAGRQNGGGYCVRWTHDVLPKLRGENGCLLMEK